LLDVPPHTTSTMTRSPKKKRVKREETTAILRHNSLAAQVLQIDIDAVSSSWELTNNKIHEDSGTPTGTNYRANYHKSVATTGDYFTKTMFIPGAVAEVNGSNEQIRVESTCLPDKSKVVKSTEPLYARNTLVSSKQQGMVGLTSGVGASGGILFVTPTIILDDITTVASLACIALLFLLPIMVDVNNIVGAAGGGGGRRGTVPRVLTTKKFMKNKHMDVSRVRLLPLCGKVTLLLLLSMMVVVESFSPLPNGNGCAYDGSEGCSRKSTDNTLNSIVDRWLDTGTRSAIEVIYGPIGDWNVSSVKNFRSLFYGHSPWAASNAHAVYVELKRTFNADISKWNVAAAEDMQASECDCCMTPQIVFSESSVNVFFLSSTFLLF
jgi:hypothetical protein